LVPKDVVIDPALDRDPVHVVVADARPLDARVERRRTSREPPPPPAV